jgi:F-type H+-transporting ATPase subunit b
MFAEREDPCLRRGNPTQALRPRLARGPWAKRQEHTMLTLAAGPLDTSIVDIVVAIVVFAIFFTLLRVLVWPKVIGGLDERSAKIRNEIDAAEKARHEAESAQKKFELKLREAQEEATRTIAEAQATARKVADELRAKNDAELADMKARALADIQSARESAVRELNEHAVALAATMAGKILRREVGPSDQSRLVAESLAELARVRN